MANPLKLQLLVGPVVRLYMKCSSEILLICFSLFLWDEMVGFYTSKGNRIRHCGFWFYCMYISHISDSLPICWLCMNFWQMRCFLNHRLWRSQMEFYKRLFLFKCFGAAKEFSAKPIWIRIVFQKMLNKIYRKCSICSWILTQNLSLFFCLILYITSV